MGSYIFGNRNRGGAKLELSAAKSLEKNQTERILLKPKISKDDYYASAITFNGPTARWHLQHKPQLIPRAKLKQTVSTTSNTTSLSSSSIERYNKELDYQEASTEEATDEGILFDAEFAKTRYRRKISRRVSSETDNTQKYEMACATFNQMEPQMISINDTISPTSHLYSDKIRIGKDAAIFEIKRENCTNGLKYSSRYEIYNSTTKPFGKSYRELTLTNSSASGVSSSCESISVSSCCSESTTYVTCNSEFEPGLPPSTTTKELTILDEEGSYETIEGAEASSNVEYEKKRGKINSDATEAIESNRKGQGSCKEQVTIKELKHKKNYIHRDLLKENNSKKEIHLEENSRNTENLKELCSNEKNSKTGKSYTGIRNRDEEIKPNTQNVVKIKSWRDSGDDEQTLKSPRLLKQMIESYEKSKLSYEVPKSSTKTSYDEEEFTYEPDSDLMNSKIVTRCRSLFNLQEQINIEDEEQELTKAVSEVNLPTSGTEEVKEPPKIVNLFLQNKKSPGKLNQSALTESFRSEMNNLLSKRSPSGGETGNNGTNEKGSSAKGAGSCRVTGEVMKSNLVCGTFSDKYRDLCTLPRTIKSHKPQLQRHFYYYMSRSRPTLKDEELPDPDKVKLARDHFQNVIKMRSCENIYKGTELGRKYNTLGTRSSHEARIPENNLHQKLRRRITLETDHPTQMQPVKWLDNHSVSSGVGSDVSGETDTESNPRADTPSDCSHKEEAIFSSEEEDQLPDDIGQPVSSEILKKIREFGTSVTYYGGKVIDKSEGNLWSPMLMTIMNEIRQNNQSKSERRKLSNDNYLKVKFQLVKSNSCGSRVELENVEESPIGDDSSSDDGVSELITKTDKNRKEPETIKEEDEDKLLEKDTTEKIVKYEQNKSVQITLNGQKQSPILSRNKRHFSDKKKNKNGTYNDMEFEEFQVLEESNHICRS